MLGVLFDPGWANRVGLAPRSRGPEGPTGSVWPGLIHVHGQCWEPAMPPLGTLRELATPSDPGGRLWQDQVRGKNEDNLRRQKPAGEGTA